MEDSNTRQLIKLYRRTGSSKALDVLLRNHQAAIKFAAAKTPTNIIAYEDKISIGNILLLKLVGPGGFDLRHKVKFSTYFIEHTKFRIIDEIRKHKKHHKNRSDNWNPSDLNNNNTQYTQLEEDELHARLVNEIANLPRTEQIVMGCIHEGMKMTEIAKQSGVSVARISQIVNKSKEILRKKMLDG